jgi:LysM repeat protein
VAADLNGNVYTIKKGDSLWGIARKYGTNVSAIKEANGMTSDTIIDGRTLIIPGQ